MSNKFKVLKDHAVNIPSIGELFADDPQRFKKFSASIDGLLLDYSRQRIDNAGIEKLLELAKQSGVETWRDRMFGGHHINTTEDRAVLHTALRGSVDEDLEVDGENVSEFVDQSLDQIAEIAATVRHNEHITDVVNIGIGGSDLGPAMVCQALSREATGPNMHFVSNVDGAHLAQTLKALKPQNTLFIIASKTFTTQETLTNAQAARDWLLQKVGEDNLADHLLAVTSNAEKAREFGLAAENILPMRDWVGGRYSLWGSIGLPIAIGLGFEVFENLLDGAADMDAHFCEAPLDQNLPVMLALTGVWNRNILACDALAVLPYAQNLARLPAYLQQLDMESNGKRISRDGGELDYATGPIVFGEPGTNGQHAFYQLLHQGRTTVPSEFIAFKEPLSPYEGHHNKLLANALAQADALAFGEDNKAEPHRHFPGNAPASFMLLDRLDAYHLGLLLALYEHKVFVQGVIWEINSFDQWGVELGKTLARSILPALDEKNPEGTFSPATTALLKEIF